eukprot:1158133-Pelagomonas_calceolata.AAC.10
MVPDLPACCTLLGLQRSGLMERSLPQLEARTEALRVQRDAIEVEDAVEVRAGNAGGCSEG